MNDLVTLDQSTTAATLPSMNMQAFAQMEQIANMMARSSTIPETLRATGTGSNKVALPDEAVSANCFRVVNQAVRWGLDPFAVLDCASLVHGRLCYEGKLVAAVLESVGKIKLKHYFFGDARTDQRGILLIERALREDEMADLATHDFPGERIARGIVADWKTTGNNSPWGPKAFDRQLIYRGTREWARLHEPATMLGIYTPEDDFDHRPMRDVTPKKSLNERFATGNADQSEGFNVGHVEQEVAATTQDQPDTGETGSLPPDAPDAEGQGVGSEPSAEGGGEAVAPSPSPLTRCCRSMLEHAADEAVPGKQRQETLAKIKDRWKAEIDEADHPKVKQFLDAANAIVKGDTNLDSAAAFFAEMLGCDREYLESGQ